MAGRRGSTAVPLLLLVGISCGLQNVLAKFCSPISIPPCWPSRDDIARFVKTLTNSSELINPDKTPDRYFSESVTMNLLKTSTPGLIVIPGTQEDLRKAVVFAFKYRIRVVMHCSGHDFNGRSNGRGVMMIKTERLNSVTYDEATELVNFGAGANHADIYGALEPYGRVYVGGQSKTVCPAGCLAGGCHGPLSRQYGLGSDNIVEIRFLLVNGTAVNATRSSYASLFNAYLGAGQNAFAIAVGFKARTWPAPPEVLSMTATFSMFHPKYPNKPYMNVFTDFFMNLAWFDSMPLELAGYINLNDQTVTVQFIYTGDSFDAVAEALSSLVNSAYIQEASEITSFPNMYEFSVNNYPPDSEIWQRKFVANAFLPHDQDTLDRLTEAIVSIEHPYLWLWFVFGGKVQSGTQGMVPAGMRHAVYQAVLGSHWNNPNEDEGNMGTIQSYLGPLYDACSTSYNNEWTTWGNWYNPLPDWKTRFYGDADNYATLLRTKQRYDPCNLLTARFSVGWDLPQAAC